MSEEQKKTECCGNCSCGNKKENIAENKLEESFFNETEEEMMKQVGILDVLVGKITSRKFMVFCLGTVFFSMNMINSTEWMLLSSVYLGVEMLLDGIIKIKSKE